jgi:hypothetical protein
MKIATVVSIAILSAACSPAHAETARSIANSIAVIEKCHVAVPPLLKDHAERLYQAEWGSDWEFQLLLAQAGAKEHFDGLPYAKQVDLCRQAKKATAGLM